MPIPFKSIAKQTGEKQSKVESEHNSTVKNPYAYAVGTLEKITGYKPKGK